MKRYKVYTLGRSRYIQYAIYPETFCGKDSPLIDGHASSCMMQNQQLDDASEPVRCFSAPAMLHQLKESIPFDVQTNEVNCIQLTLVRIKKELHNNTSCSYFNGFVFGEITPTVVNSKMKQSYFKDI